MLGPVPRYALVKVLNQGVGGACNQRVCGAAAAGVTLHL